MGISVSATLTIRNKKDFSRVCEIVKPIDEDDSVSELAFDKAIDYAMNLPIKDRSTWMARHCKKLCI